MNPPEGIFWKWISPAGLGVAVVVVGIGTKAHFDLSAAIQANSILITEVAGKVIELSGDAADLRRVNEKQWGRIEGFDDHIRDLSVGIGRIDGKLDALMQAIGGAE